MARISSGLASDLATAVPPNSLLKAVAIQLKTKTNGINSQEKNVRGRAKNIASLSACWAATVLGVVSVKMSRKAVSPSVAYITPCSPQKLMASAVAMAAAAVLASVLPKRTVDSSFSGRAIILETRFAPLTLFSTRCSILTLCK